MKKLWAYSVILFFSVGCLAQNNNSLLWRISNSKNDHVSYLFGTIHLPQKKFIVYSDSVYEAIQQVATFYNEIDFLNQSFFGDKELMNFLEEKGKYLDSVKSTPPWISLINRINRKYNTDLDPANLEDFISFSQQAMNSQFEPEEGVTVPDMMLAKFARSLGKKTGGLETYLLQFKMLYDIIDTRIMDTTLELEDEANLIISMKEFYLKENIDSIASIVEAINETYRKVVFDNRNKAMSDSIAKFVVNEPSFFAIGAGHLGGRYGVIDLLRKKGFIVTPVHSQNKMSILVINNLLNKNKYKDDEASAVEELIDTKIEVMETPPPPPPKKEPLKVEMKPATKGKTKGTKGDQ